VLGPIAWYLANSAVGYGGASSFECQGTPISIGTHPVGQKATNAFGLSDVAGNVWEWVLECPALYPAGPQLDPLGPLDCGHDNKLYRGGGLGNVAIFLRHAERAAWTPDGVMRDIGFRPVRTLP
jgi:formylglycine-generating enzyme required for sulfatase activity